MTRKHYALILVFCVVVALLALWWYRRSEQRPPTPPYVPGPQTGPQIKASPRPTPNSILVTPQVSPTVKKAVITRNPRKAQVAEASPTPWTNVPGYERVYYGPNVIDGYVLGAGLKAIPTTITGDHPLLCPSNPLKLNPCFVILPGVRLMISQCFKTVPCPECSRSLPTKLVFDVTCGEERSRHAL